MLNSDNFAGKLSDFRDEDGIFFLLVLLAFSPNSRRFGLDTDLDNKSFQVFIFFALNPASTVAQMASRIHFDTLPGAHVMTETLHRRDLLNKVGRGLKNDPYRYSVSSSISLLVYREVYGAVDAAQKTVKRLKLNY